MELEKSTVNMVTESPDLAYLGRNAPTVKVLFSAELSGPSSTY